MISEIIKVEVLSAEPKAEADNSYRDIDYLGYQKKPNLIIVLLYIILKKITTNTPPQGTKWTLFLEIMHCARNLTNL